MDKGMNRRDFLGRVWWGVTGILALEAGAGLVASLWPQIKPGSFGSNFNVASVPEVRAMPVGTVAYFPEARLYLSRVEAGFLALYRKCTHLGCVIPWLSDDPTEDKLGAQGRFNCPCHASIFDRYGLVHAGPAPRPLDIFPILVEGEEVMVDTGTVLQRSSYHESQATKV
ncbi:MAG: Rieske 2Fe-2S domain-containing protein [Dehalococcoidia bacterium]|nr:Rieske 2Fe-2S domain-containing protein [Dehalococcoidia bacterium]